MTIRTKNQVFLSNDIPVYGGEQGGATLQTDFLLKLDTYQAERAGGGTKPSWKAAKIKDGSTAADGRWTWGTAIGAQQIWDESDHSLTFPDAPSETLEWEDGIPDVGATDDMVIIVVCKFNDTSGTMSVGNIPATDGVRFHPNKSRVSAVTNNQDDTFTNDAPTDEFVALYFRGIGAANFTGNSGWRARSDSTTSSIKSEDTAEKTYTGAMTIDFSPAAAGNSSTIKPDFATLYSVFLAVYPTGTAPSLEAVQEACQWHVDKHTSAEGLADPATYRVPYHKL